MHFCLPKIKFTYIVPYLHIYILKVTAQHLPKFVEKVNQI